MSTISISEARGNLSETIKRSAVEAVFIESHKKVAAVVISPERYEQFMDALEQIEDEKDFDEAMADSKSSIPWDEVKKILGL